MSLNRYQVTSARKRQVRSFMVLAESIGAALVKARREELGQGYTLTGAKGGGQEVTVIGECYECGRFLLELREGGSVIRDEHEPIPGRRVSCGPDCPARAA